MERFTLHELLHLNGLVRKAKSRHIMAISESAYFQCPIGECPAYVQRSRKLAAELSDIQRKLETMIIEAED